MPLKIEKRGSIWHYSGTVAGRRLRGTCGTTDKKIAQRIAAEVEAKAWRSHLDGPGADVSFAQCAIAYRKAEKPTRFLEAIEDHWKDAKVKDITKGGVRASAIKLYPNGSGATRNRQVIVPTMAIINFAAELEWCNPIKVPRFDVNPVEKTPASPEWVQAFITQAKKDELPWLAALAAFMFATGARVTEACNLTWTDVDLFKKTAIVRMKKPKPWQRTAHLPAQLVVHLSNIPSNRNPEDLVFGYAGRGSVTKVWNNVVERAEIETLTPHCCRHGFATTMLRKGIDVATIAKRGGWKDPSIILKTYAHALEDHTVTEDIFDTEVTQRTTEKTVTYSKKRRN